jgi:transcriptional regulator with XRE-family HTH domain
VDLEKKNQMETLSPERVREIRESVGLSQGGLASLLGLGSGSAKTVRRWESGEISCPGPVAFCLQALADGYRPASHGLRLPIDHIMNQTDTKARLETIRDIVQELLDAPKATQRKQDNADTKGITRS